jgi:excisionase family DNA binding protein
MKPASKPLSPAKAPARRATAALAIAARGTTRGPATSTTSGFVAKRVTGLALTARAGKTSKMAAMPALKVSIEVDPLVDVVRRHVHLSPSLAKIIKGDFMRLFQNPTVGASRTSAPAQPVAETDPVLSTQEAAELVGVSRPYIVARIDAGDIPLHQQVGNQRRVLKSAVLAWHRREQTRRRRALGQLGADLDSEIFAG